MNHFYGSDETSCLLRIPHRVPCSCPRSRDPIGQQTDTASIRSASTSRSSSAPAAFLDLQEMFLLVDVDTELQDVQQVELNFKRHSLTKSAPKGVFSAELCPQGECILH